MNWKQDVLAAAGSLLFVLPAYAQTVGSSGKDSSVNAAERPGMVLAFIHRTNQHEIEMARLAREKSNSNAVKKFANTIMKDHQAADQKVQSLAKTRKIDLDKAEQELLSINERGRKAVQDDMVRSREVRSPTGEYARPFSDLTPTSQHQQEMDDLRKLSGSSFDRQFAQDMVDDHQAAIDRLTSVRSRLEDPGVNQLIDKLLPTLREHRSMAESLQSSVRTSG